MGGGLRKVRMAIRSKGKGKSGGARVITLIAAAEDDGEIGLHYLYDKSERENLSETEIQEILRLHGVR